MKIAKTLICAMLSVFLVISPFTAALAVCAATPAQYGNTFVGVLDEKYERLNSIEEDKIVIVGGSSVAFGINSELIEKYTGIPAVNFGLYAALGTKLMLDLSRSAIDKGDIVIIAPEMNSETLSLYFNSNSTLQAVDGNYSMLSKLPFDNLFSVIGASWNFAAEKLGYIESGSPPSPSGVYSSSSFNEYGDISYRRKENVMPYYYDPNSPITLDETIVSKDFLDYINEYVAFCRLRGAEVYFSWCPMNELALTNSESDGSVSAFQRYIKENLDCKLISEIENYILEPGYFYDTNFHLNDSGMLRHSVNLTKDILLELGIPKLVEAPDDEELSDQGLIVVTKPELPGADLRYFEEDENAKYFEFRQNENGSYEIIGLSEEGLLQKSLTIPNGYNSYVVSSVAEAAFSGGALEELIIPAGTKLKIFKNGSFRGASSLGRLVIYHSEAQDILPPESFSGVKAGFTVFIPEGSNYEFDYYWSERGLAFERIEKQ